MVPKMMHNTMTNDIKTAIFARLRFNAFPKLALSPMNRVSFKILNTRNKRKALRAIKECDPKINKERYFGMVDKRSMIP